MSLRRRHERKANPSGKILLGIFLFILIAILTLTGLSCGSEEGNETGDQAVSQEDNAQSLGRIMGHRNQLEGGLNEPVDAVITGDVTAVAESGEETWVLVKVAGFRTTDAAQGSLNAAPGSELAVKMRITESGGPVSAGDAVEINALVSKSLEGPVIVGRSYRVLE